MTARSPRDAILELLSKRDAGATICPSEAARLVSGEAWRAAMDPVHEAAAALAAQGEVKLSQRGETVAAPIGAHRIRRS